MAAEGEGSFPCDSMNLALLGNFCLEVSDFTCSSREFSGSFWVKQEMVVYRTGQMGTAQSLSSRRLQAGWGDRHEQVQEALLGCC